MNSIADMMFWVSLERGRYSHPLSIVPYQSQVYSQNGEDGVIAEIFTRIGDEGRFFVEIGIEDGLQCNTRFLLERGWRGIWVEADASNAAKALTTFRRFVDEGTLAVVVEAATVDNVNDLLDRAGAPSQYDFLSLDVDHNTSHLWKALRSKSRAACIEYNASLPPSLDAQVPYHPLSQWNGTNWYGASLKALEEIGIARNMNLVGCELAGVNAFFVASVEAQGRFQSPFTAKEHYEPPRYSLVKTWGHPPAATAGSRHLESSRRT